MTETEDLWAGLMRSAIAGGGRAYARLLHAITPVVRGIVRARGRSLPPDQHEDIVQEVLLAIHAKRHTWAPDQPLRPWLFAITRYKVIDAFRRRGVTVYLPIDEMAEVLEDETAQAHVSGAEAEAEVAQLIGGLDERSARIVTAIKLQEQTPAEVAAQMKVTEGALRVSLHRALKKLEVLAKRQRDADR